MAHVLHELLHEQLAVFAALGALVIVVVAGGGLVVAGSPLPVDGWLGVCWHLLLRMLTADIKIRLWGASGRCLQNGSERQASGLRNCEPRSWPRGKHKTCGAKRQDAASRNRTGGFEAEL